MIYLSGICKTECQYKQLKNILKKFMYTFNIICLDLMLYNENINNNYYLKMLNECDELWIYMNDDWQKDNKIQQEIKYAKENNIKLKYIKWDD